MSSTSWRASKIWKRVSDCRTSSVPRKQAIPFHIHHIILHFCDRTSAGGVSENQGGAVAYPLGVVAEPDKNNRGIVRENKRRGLQHGGTEQPSSGGQGHQQRGPQHHGGQYGGALSRKYGPPNSSGGGKNDGPLGRSMSMQTSSSSQAQHRGGKGSGKGVCGRSWSVQNELDFGALMASGGFNHGKNATPNIMGAAPAGPAGGAPMMLGAPPLPGSNYPMRCSSTPGDYPPTALPQQQIQMLDGFSVAGNPLGGPQHQRQQQSHHLLQQTTSRTQSHADTLAHAYELAPTELLQQNSEQIAGLVDSISAQQQQLTDLLLGRDGVPVANPPGGALHLQSSMTGAGTTSFSMPMPMQQQSNGFVGAPNYSGVAGVVVTGGNPLIQNPPQHYQSAPLMQSGVPLLGGPMLLTPHQPGIMQPSSGHQSVPFGGQPFLGQQPIHPSGDNSSLQAPPALFGGTTTTGMLTRSSSVLSNGTSGPHLLPTCPEDTSAFMTSTSQQMQQSAASIPQHLLDSLPLSLPSLSTKDTTIIGSAPELVGPNNSNGNPVSVLNSLASNGSAPALMSAEQVVALAHLLNNNPGANTMINTSLGGGCGGPLSSCNVPPHFTFSSNFGTAQTGVGMSTLAAAPNGAHALLPPSPGANGCFAGSAGFAGPACFNTGSGQEAIDQILNPAGVVIPPMLLGEDGGLVEAADRRADQHDPEENMNMITRRCSSVV